MRASTNRPRPALALAAVVLVLAGCGSAATPTGSTASAAAPGTASPVASSPGSQPAPTPVPGGQTVAPPGPTGVPTTQTEWGEILDVLPATFPMHPGAKAADSVDGPVSASFTVPVGTDDAANWYVDALGGLGYAVTLSDALEDGSRVLDAASDLPECMVRMDFRPASGSTMISVLYAAGCAGLGS